MSQRYLKNNKEGRRLRLSTYRKPNKGGNLAVWRKKKAMEKAAASNNCPIKIEPGTSSLTDTTTNINSTSPSRLVIETEPGTSSSTNTIKNKGATSPIKRIIKTEPGVSSSTNITGLQKKETLCEFRKWCESMKERKKNTPSIQKKDMNSGLQKNITVCEFQKWCESMKEKQMENTPGVQKDLLFIEEAFEEEIPDSDENDIDEELVIPFSPHEAYEAIKRLRATFKTFIPHRSHEANEKLDYLKDELKNFILKQKDEMPNNNINL